MSSSWTPSSRCFPPTDATPVSAEIVFFFRQASSPRGRQNQPFRSNGKGIRREANSFPSFLNLLHRRRVFLWSMDHGREIGPSRRVRGGKTACRSTSRQGAAGHHERGKPRPARPRQADQACSRERDEHAVRVRIRLLAADRFVAANLLTVAKDRSRAARSAVSQARSADPSPKKKDVQAYFANYEDTPSTMRPSVHVDPGTGGRFRPTQGEEVEREEEEEEEKETADRAGSRSHRFSDQTRRRALQTSIATPPRGPREVGGRIH